MENWDYIPLNPYWRCLGLSGQSIALTPQGLAMPFVRTKISMIPGLAILYNLGEIKNRLETKVVMVDMPSF